MGQSLKKQGVPVKKTKNRVWLLIKKLFFLIAVGVAFLLGLFIKQKKSVTGTSEVKEIRHEPTINKNHEHRTIPDNAYDTFFGNINQ